MELKVLVIDEDARSLKNIERICKGIQGISSVVSFGSPVLALDYIEENFHDVQVVFTEIEMSEMTGIELASRIHEISEDIRVVFATLAPQYALRAFEVDAVGYLLKPVDPVQIEKQILKLVRMTNFTQKPRVFMRTFGHFDVFVGGVAVRFSSSKAKELLALLVDRQGGVVSMQQAISTLWPERKYDDSVRSLYRNVLQSLREALQEAEISEVFVNSRNSRSVNITTFECDLYQLLDGKARGITSFNGEYMVDYLWAEPTIELIKEKIADKRAH